VRPHYFAGWEGGAKALLPGCSNLETIAKNHSYVIGNPNARELIVEGNPVREDMNEVASIVEAQGIKYRIADFVPNLDDEPVLIKYGEPVQTHLELTRFGKSLYTAETKPFSLVVTVAWGYSGENLFQAFKAYHLASNAAKADRERKSKVILVASLREGIGSETFSKEMIRYAGVEPKQILEDLKERAGRGEFNETLQKINRIAMDLEKTDLAVVSPEAPKEVEKLLEESGITFSRDLDEILKLWLHIDSVLVIPYGSFTIPIPT
jgi:nickel-dependent lactate racemase